MIKIYTLTFWISFKGFKGTLLILRIQWYFGRLKVSMGIVVVLGAFWSFFIFSSYFSRFRDLRLFWSIKSFQRVFFVWIFCGFGGVLVILGV